MHPEQTTLKTFVTRTEYHTLKKAKLKKAKSTKLKREVSGVVLATAILTTATATSAASLTEYIVNKNDTYYNLSKQFGVTVEQLQQINSKQNSQLLTGEKMLIPQTDEEKAVYTERVVKAGDTWYQYSKEVNVPVNELLQLNNKTSDLLMVNEIILLPSIKTETVQTVKAAVEISKANEKETVEATVVVQKGDTLWKIAREYRTTVDELRAANHLKSNNIKVGQVLVIDNITKASAIIVGAADSNFVEFKQPNKESIVLKVTPFHSVEQFSNRTGLAVTIQYNEELNELISFEVK